MGFSGVQSTQLLNMAGGVVAFAVNERAATVRAGMPFRQVIIGTVKCLPVKGVCHE